MILSDKPIFEMKRTVLANEIDDLNHVNNVVYVQWVNDVAVKHWLSKAPQHIVDVTSWFLIEHTIRYKKQAFLGDIIRVRTQTGRATNVRYERFVEIYNDYTGDLLATSKSDWCALDKTGKPQRISDELRKIFEVLT